MQLTCIQLECTGWCAIQCPHSLYHDQETQSQYESGAYNLYAAHLAWSWASILQGMLRLGLSAHTDVSVLLKLQSGDQILTVPPVCTGHCGSAFSERPQMFVRMNAW